MRKSLILAVLLLGSLSLQAQEKVMNIQMADGTTAQTRVADLKRISFLTIGNGNQGLIVKTSGGESVTIRFEANPVVTVEKGKLNITSSQDEDMAIEITNISEIQFGESDGTAISEIEGFSCIIQDGGILLQGIPHDLKPCIYSIDGRSLPTPTVSGNELRLNHATLGPGIYIVKVGSFATKIKINN